MDIGVLQGGKRGEGESGETEHSPPTPEPGDKQPSVLAPSYLTARRHGDLPNLGAAGRTWWHKSREQLEEQLTFPKLKHLEQRRMPNPRQEPPEMSEWSPNPWFITLAQLNFSGCSRESADWLGGEGKP